jgi:hypothetical protein
MATREQPGAEALNLPERYRARRHLASGGMASVWCADDLVLGRTVAVKVLADRFEHDDMAGRRFKREARAAARVSNHAHVVTIFDVGDLEPTERGVISGRPFIVMEYLAGGTVADAIRVGAVRRQEAVRWLDEAASALDHAHERGIVHRDIKPANFLLNRNRVLHVADFGIARLLSEDTITTAGELFGTAAYLSPEQALGREATGASDRYALAVAAFELLAGERPFGAVHFAAQARQHIEDPPPAASERDRTLPPAVDEVLMRGMAKEPDRRFETAGAFVDALRDALASEVAPATQRFAPARARGTRPGAAYAGAAPRRQRNPAVLGRTAADPLARRSASHRRGGRLIALAALLVAIAGVAVVALAGTGGAKHAPTVAKAKPRTTARTTKSAKPKASAKAPSATSTTSTTATTPAAPPTPEQLQVTGHQEMLAGNYPAAITTLRKAVSSASPTSLTYAYGLYDLGLALLKSGDPAGAVPVLEQRAKIPNQQSVVLETLKQALQASGQAPAQLSTPQGPQKGHGGGKDDGGSGGAGLAPSGKGPGDGEHSNFAD